jgi:hypothetical protein
MAFVAALIALEKLLPWRVVANRAIAALLLAIGIGLAVAPHQVPALTVPSPAAGGSMMRMDGGGKPKTNDAPKGGTGRSDAMPAPRDGMQPMP